MPQLLLLDVPDAVMMSRLKDGENFNDTEETILKRIRTFHEVTAPVVASFADVATRVNFVCRLTSVLMYFR